MTTIGFVSKQAGRRVINAARDVERAAQPPISGLIGGLIIRPGALYSDPVYREAVVTWYSGATEAYTDNTTTVLVRNHESATPPVYDVPVFCSFHGYLDGYAVYIAAAPQTTVSSDAKYVRIIEHDGTTPYPITVREVTWDGVSATSYTDVDGSGKSDFEAYDFDGNYARTAAQFAAAGCNGIHVAYGPDSEGDYHLILNQPAGYTASNYKTTAGGAGHYGGYVNIAGQRFKGRKWFGTTAIGEDDVPGFTDDGGLWTSNFCVTVGGDVGTADSVAGDGTGGYDADRWTMYANNGFGGVGTTQALFIAPPSFLDSSGKMDGDECTTAVVSDGTYLFEGFSVGGSLVVTNGNQEDPENPGNYTTTLNLAANTSGLIPINGSGGGMVMARMLYVTNTLGVGGLIRVWDGSAYVAGATEKVEYTTGKYLNFYGGVFVGSS